MLIKLCSRNSSRKRVKGIDKLFKTMTQLNQSMLVLTGTMSEDSKGAMKTILLKPWIFASVLKYWNLTLSEMLNRFVHDEKLIAVFTQLSGSSQAISRIRSRRCSSPA